MELPETWREVEKSPVELEQDIEDVLRQVAEVWAASARDQGEIEQLKAESWKLGEETRTILADSRAA